MFFKDKKEYEDYLSKNQVSISNENTQKYFSWSEDGEILIENSILRKSTIDVDNYTNCLDWNMLKDNETMVLLKRPFGDIYRGLSIDDYYIAIYNNILLPQIAKQLGNESAKYYIAKDKERKNGKKIVTIDFKRKDEELIHGEDILERMGESIRELNIRKLLDTTEDYLIEKGYYNQDIENIKKDFIKQSFFNKFIKQFDENNHNWGILVNSKLNSARIAPLYDLDCSCDIGKLSKHMRTTDNESFNSMEQFMKQYKDEDWFEMYIKEVISKFNIEEAFKDSEEETNTKIPVKYKQRYKDFFAVRFYELKQAYEKVFITKGENQAEREDITK